MSVAPLLLFDGRRWELMGVDGRGMGGMGVDGRGWEEWE